MEEGTWAQPVDRLHVHESHKHVAFNLEGRRVAGPHQGFGSLWDRTFTIPLGEGVSPEHLVAAWRARFGEFWPKGATFHGSMTSIQAGDVAPLTAGGGAVTTGVLVIYADDTSFGYMTPEGHMFAGMITFSARSEDGPGTVAEIRMLVRPADPAWQVFWPVVKRMEGGFWKATLVNLAAAHGVAGVAAEHSVCVDRKWLWRNWTNVFTNGAVISVLYGLRKPFRRRTRTGRGETR
jgi:Domain of unknown function (DUF1990)